eukprot:7042911-Heterocapsa_arctica.AAC.1
MYVCIRSPWLKLARTPGLPRASIRPVREDGGPKVHSRGVRRRFILPFLGGVRRGWLGGGRLRSPRRAGVPAEKS